MPHSAVNPSTVRKEQAGFLEGNGDRTKVAVALQGPLLVHNCHGVEISTGLYAHCGGGMVVSHSGLECCVYMGPWRKGRSRQECPGLCTAFDDGNASCRHVSDSLHSHPHHENRATRHADGCVWHGPLDRRDGWRSQPHLTGRHHTGFGRRMVHAEVQDHHPSIQWLRIDIAAAPPEHSHAERGPAGDSRCSSSQHRMSGGSMCSVLGNQAAGYT